jgi:diketogulonate reductase-like aldo/keto reductase
LEYRELGKTGEKVPTIGMGTWRIGNFHSQDEKAEQVRALRRGVELGMNFIDTAEMYGGGRSEQLVGDAVGDMRDSIFIASKVSPDHLHQGDLVAACEGSLRRLGTRYIDLYQIHWPNPSVPIRETMSAMEQLVREGKIRYVGVSNFSLRETADAMDALSKSELVSNQVEYSLAKRSVEDELLPYCQKEGVTVIAYSPLAKGSIQESWIPDALLAKYRVTPAQAMLNWVTRRDGVIAIPKAGRVDHVEQNATSASPRFTSEEYDSMADRAVATR